MSLIILVPENNTTECVHGSCKNLVLHRRIHCTISVAQFEQDKRTQHLIINYHNSINFIVTKCMLRFVRLFMVYFSTYFVLQVLFHWNAENCTPLLMHQKVDGSTYFNRPWEMFKSGFGNKYCNYWLGNELLHQLTKDGLYKLRYDVQALDSGQWYWAEYSTFIVDSEANKYGLVVNGYSGNAGDAMKRHNNYFTTFDSDNDDITLLNCAVDRGGGFWWNKCGWARVTAAADQYVWKSDLGTIQLKTSRGWLICVWSSFHWRTPLLRSLTWPRDIINNRSYTYQLLALSTIQITLN